MRYILPALVIAVAQWSCQSSPKPDQLANSLRPVKVGKLWGYADDSGVTRIKPRFLYAHEFSDGFAMVQPDATWGVRFIDARGTFIGGERFFEWAGPFGDGLAPAREAERIYGFIDTSGKWVIAPRYAGVHCFTEGLAAVQATGNGAWGYIDRRGRMTIPGRYWRAGEFHAGLAPVEQFGKSGFIDRTGAWVIPPRFEDAGLFSAEGLAPVQVKQRAGLVWGFADRTGNLVLPVQYEGAKAFSQGFAPAKLAGKWGFVDSKGQWAVSPQFDELERLEHGWARAMQGDRIGYVNAKGERLHWKQ